MADYLLTSYRGPLPPEAAGQIEQIANILAGSGLRAVKLDELERAAMLNDLRECNGKSHARGAEAGDFRANASAEFEAHAVQRSPCLTV